MSKTEEPVPKEYTALHRPALAMVTIGALADEAVRKHSSLVHQGDDAERTAIKIDGSSVAGYWREGARSWIDHNPGANTVWSEAVENGWPEFLVADKYHVFLHRHNDFNRSARSAVLEHQGTDTYMVFPTLPGLDLDTLPPTKQRITVRVTANHDELGRMTGAEVFAPQGNAPALFRFTIGAEEVVALKAQWLMHDTPWLDTINRVGSMTLADVGREHMPFPTTADTERPKQEAAPGASPAIGDEHGVRPKFEPNEHTQRPAQEHHEDEQQPGTQGTGTDQ